MRIALCPACNKWTEVYDDGNALYAVDCDKCGFSQTWLISEDVDVETKKIVVGDDATKNDIDSFMDFLNSLML